MSYFAIHNILNALRNKHSIGIVLGAVSVEILSVNKMFNNNLANWVCVLYGYCLWTQQPVKMKYYYNRITHVIISGSCFMHIKNIHFAKNWPHQKKKQKQLFGMKTSVRKYSSVLGWNSSSHKWNAMEAISCVH